MASITGKPKGKVSSQTNPIKYMGGSNHRWKATWSVPSAHTSDSNGTRATGIRICWELDFGGGRTVEKYWTGGTSYTSSWFGMGLGWGLGRWENYQSYYPYTNSKLYYVNLWVQETNGKGRGPWNKTAAKIGTPPSPTMPALEQDEETGRVTTTVKQDRHENWSNACQVTEYEVWVRDSRTDNGKWRLAESGRTRATEKALAYDVTQRQELGYGDWVEVKMQARAHGFNSATAWVTRSLTVSYPSQATIKNATGTRNATDKAVVYIGSLDSRYTTGCRLQTLVNTEYEDPLDIPADANWQDTESVDNAVAAALSASVADVIPAAGRTSWVRVKTWNQFEDMFYRFSEPYRLTALEAPAPTGQDDEIKLLSLASDYDGESAVALFGWNADGQDDADYTEVTWADDENAWRSTSAPNNFKCEWSDGVVTWDSVTYQDSATVYIAGLKEDKTYYVRGRRVKEVNGEPTYSNYTDTLVVRPTYTPPTVELTVPGYIARGASLPVSWTFSSDAAQTSWQLIRGTVDSQDVFTEEEIVAASDDALGYAVVSADRLAGLVGTDGSVSLAVRVAAGGGYITSEARTVTIADRPVLEAADDTVEVDSQGFTVDFTCTGQAALAAVLTADGAGGDTPGGGYMQVSGDTVYAGSSMPEWTQAAGETVYSASLDIPEGLELIDGANYTLTAKATDPMTGLESEPVVVSVSVDWAHKAPAPADTITVTASDTTDAQGFRTRKAEIQLAAASGMASSDVYDVYRVTADGSYLIAHDQGQTDLVTDLYAPFCNDGAAELAYRVVSRTADGSIDWRDYGYTLQGSDLRIDFGPQYVELPYNLNVGDAFTKDFEARAHLGEREPQGYWNEGVSRKASFSTDLLRVASQEQVAALRALARYDGPCFVRIPNGCAYQANVDVSGLDEGYDSAAVAVSLDGVEVALTDPYLALAPERSEGANPDESGE